jgi:hypothetical protein
MVTVAILAVRYDIRQCRIRSQVYRRVMQRAIVQKNLCRDLNNFTANVRFGREIDRLRDPKLDWPAVRLEPMPPIYDL